MTALNKQALRKLAQEATGANERLMVMPADDIFDISLHEGTQLDADITALNAFNEAANPATVLALLDELEAADALNKHLELAIRGAEGCSEALRRKSEAAEKRIAELVARIYIPQPLNIEDEYQNYEYVAGWNDCRNATACRSEHIDRDTGIGVKGE